MTTHFKICSLLFVVLSWLLPNSSLLDACTGVKLVSQDGSIVHGRTLEFGVKVELSVAVVPRKFQFTGTTPKGPGLAYKAKYGSVGMMAFGKPALLDGFNEKGLAVGTFYFPGFAEYPTITTENQSRALSPIEFPNWILTQFATIEEVKENLSKVLIAPTTIQEWGPTAPPFHYIVFDKSGKCLVIEPIKGQLRTYDNPLGVFTNSPTFEWHMENLRNYIHLTALNAKPLQTAGLTFSSFGQGSGMLGMPGDFTPPSRFVRAAFFSITALPSPTAKECVGQLFHVLNQFDIPIGVVRAEENSVIYFDYTQCICVRDPQSLKYYFKTADNQTIRMVNLNSFDLDAKSLKQMNLAQEEEYLDLSAELK